ncbi:MAG: helix-turn-helix domain-containing protein [Candidatus Bathyarchaeota archaeon]|nr:helix-turn-helix domain-containing protein [Candidatus Bathyarchaeota archaeon A05DMB-5]MDH7557681.1 helix-turn-helix domain-containing protein [Candidatus Bathyarchaeota archaeon]
MILPCEVAAKSIVPAIKALMAKQLAEKYNLKQDKVAEILGISQSAVSKYTRNIRGHVIKIDKTQEIDPLINRMITLLLNGAYPREELLRNFCQTCIIIRKKGLMCQYCKKADPKIKIEECHFCST